MSLRTTDKAMGGAAGSYPQQTRENAQSVGEKRVNVEGRKNCLGASSPNRKMSGLWRLG